MTAFWEIAAHSAYNMCSWYTYLSVILVFTHPAVYGVGISFDLAAGGVPCGGRKKSPRTPSIVQIIFLSRSFEISKDI